MTHKEIETKNGIKYYFWDSEKSLIASVREDGKLISHNRDMTEEEKIYINDIVGFRVAF